MCFGTLCARGNATLFLTATFFPSLRSVDLIKMVYTSGERYIAAVLFCMDLTLYLNCGNLHTKQFYELPFGATQKAQRKQANEQQLRKKCDLVRIKETFNYLL